MLIDQEKKKVILGCNQEPKDKLSFKVAKDGSIRVEMRNLLSGGFARHGDNFVGVARYEDNFVEVDLASLEQTILELKKLKESV